MNTFVSGRPIIFAMAAAAILVVGVMYVRAMLRPGTPVRRFHELPGGIADDLEQRGCNIVKGPNVISGDFGGERGWAALSRQGDVASLMIYVEGGKRPVVFGRHGAGLEGDPEAARSIRVVHWDYVARHNPWFKIDPAAIPEDCIEDGAGMESSLYCYLDGVWIMLSGAD